jgi:hypothetical protein
VTWLQPFAVHWETLPEMIRALLAAIPLDGSVIDEQCQLSDPESTTMPSKPDKKVGR